MYVDIKILISIACGKCNANKKRLFSHNAVFQYLARAASNM